MENGKWAALLPELFEDETGHVVVYFVQAKALGLIKIGIAVDASARLAALRTGSPDRLELLGVIPVRDAVASERALHRAFRPYHSHGEWFRPAPSLLELIGSYASPWTARTSAPARPSAPQRPRGSRPSLASYKAARGIA